MKKQVAAAALSLAVLAGPGPLAAQDAPTGAAGEKSAPLTQLFISPCGEPFRAVAAAPYPVVVWFAKADTNHDGAIDQAEFRADADAFFTSLDVDHSGVITSPEVWRYEHEVAPEIALGAQIGRLDAQPRIILAQFGGYGGGGPSVSGTPSSDENDPKPDRSPSIEGAAVYTLLHDTEPVTGADGDFNGRITRQEFRDAADRRFARLDKAGQGRLTLAALPMSWQERALGSRHRPARRS